MRSENKRKHVSENVRSGGILSGVVLLALSTFLCKIIGLLFKIPIINIVGIDGMAYFSSAYNIYMLLNSIAAAGLPVALSILISQNRAVGSIGNIRKIFIIASCAFLILGIAGTMALYYGADVYSDLIGIKLASPAVKAIAPTLLFICISGAIRGFFQGHELMAPTAISQLLESLGKLILGVGFAAIALRNGLDSSYTASAAILGLSAGVFVSVIYLTIHLFLFIRKRYYGKTLNACINTDNNSKIIRDLFIIAFPITVSSCVTSLTSLADTALITNRLVASGFSLDASVSLYSSYTNLAIPLFNLPPALITALGVSLIPSLSAAIARKNDIASKRVFNSSVKLCNAFSIPAAAGIAVFAKPILTLIYPGEIDACNFAAPLLSILSAAIVFSCLTTVCNAVLQAYMKPALPVCAMGAGAIVKIIVEYFLVGGNCGIYGAPISTVACTFTILIIDIIFIYIYTPQRFELFSLFRILLATVADIGLSVTLYYLLSKTGITEFWVLLLVVGSAVVIYIIFSLILGVIRYSDITGFSIGRRIADFLKKKKLIKE